ncbi:thiopeptide-type bacteriocin biosynthesis protein [Micromonospora sp. WMMD1082]|uniref:thiopeptide-type bacteriocin biosynthesis protein n=1 Tax=Micromonospora sp. WMMD1082 TaxID=3016104 RepID=UPI002416F8B4|nr:thiopeptide-type bacteriocin biosynthesis protein [Micromonospora sp. WMMD1082]MDG4796326.1 thiopeptide-type bacteriocin biosynthesis protein [Micromonospora sp. WMMD1082]
MTSPPSLSTPGWCLLRIPVLPAVPADAAPDGLARQLLELAIDYATVFQRATEDDREWQDPATRWAVYGSRATYRPTPFGVFSFSLLAEVDDGDGVPATRLELETDVRLRRLDLPGQTGEWFVNPSLAAEHGRWSYLHPEKGGITSMSEAPGARRLAERLAAQLAAAPRSAREWATVLGGEAEFDLCVGRRLLLPQHTPPMLVDLAEPAAPTEAVKAALATERPFRDDQFVDAFSDVRLRLPGADAAALLDGAGQLLEGQWRPRRLDRVRDHVAGGYTGAAVPLVWLLTAPVDHPLGSWRRPEAEPEGTNPLDPARRLFVPQARRDSGAVQWWQDALTLDQWRARHPLPGGDDAGLTHPQFGMVNGALLAEPVAGADAWIKLVLPGFWGGPGARLSEQLGIPKLDLGTDPGWLPVELGWVSPDRRAPLVRRPESGLPRLNLNLPHRAGDLRLADLAVTMMAGRLQLVHRSDGRYVQLRWDSPLTLSNRFNPWVVQLLGLLLDEAQGPALVADPSQWAPPGGMVPRVTTGRCLVARRSVVLDAQHRVDLLTLAEDPVQLCDVLTEVGLGPQLEASEGPDVTMRLDLTDDTARRWLVRRLRRESRLVLHETLPVATLVESELGGHLHDVWVPWRGPAPRPVQAMSRSRLLERQPAADPEWTSWYVYAPERVVELWLARPEIVALMRQANLFYIRYRDERPHLRLRVHRGVDAEPYLADLRAHLAAMVPQQPCEVDVRNWTPEDHRYGGATSRADAVRLFCADSAWWAQRLAAGPDQTGRYTLAAARIAAWCRQLAGEERALTLLCDLRGLDPRLPSSRAQREWMENYRAARSDLERAFDAALAEPEPGLGYLAGLDGDAYATALSSLIHMSVNRGLPMGQAVGRESELVLAAARLLKGRQARAVRGRAVDG